MRSKLVNINEVLKSIESLDIEDQAYILNILSKRLVELRRSEIAKRAIEAEQAYIEGKVKRGDFNSLWKDLND
ncbi:MAG: hypothetical protein ACE5J9_06760 [Methanosarcinales archaeon]